MNLAITYSRANIGIHAPLVTVETHISNGLPSLNIVGLPETAVRESKDRVRSAILNSNFEFPLRRITVNLAPADLPKQGGRYDLPIALGILAASKQIPANRLMEFEFAAELALSGELRPINGILPFIMATRACHKNLVFSYQNVQEAELISDVALFPAKHLLDVCTHFLDKNLLIRHQPNKIPASNKIQTDLSQVRGQHHAKRAIEIAAAGNHGILLIGPPGVGKTLLSHCLPGILPPMSEPEALDLATIQSVAEIKISEDNWRIRPFRAPHHSASHVAIIGGGNPVQPGEISLAHHGVLFLDELPEFKRQALEALREPLESGTISISRANLKIQYPAKFQLVAAMNPCPCGYFGSTQTDCICSQEAIKKYQSRVSGPLLDRIDIHSELLPLPPATLTSSHTPPKDTSSFEVAKRVALAIERQLSRANKPNAFLNNKEIEKFSPLTTQDRLMLEKLILSKKMSARSYFKVLKIALTLADLEQSKITTIHLKEALSYRLFEKFKFR
jgi:magnesium chelatase family protein